MTLCMHQEWQRKVEHTSCGQIGFYAHSWHWYGVAANGGEEEERKTCRVEKKKKKTKRNYCVGGLKVGIDPRRKSAATILMQKKPNSIRAYL